MMIKSIDAQMFVLVTVVETVGDDETGIFHDEDR